MKNTEQGFISKIIEGLCESTKEAHEVQRALTSEQKEAFVKRHSEAIKPDSGLQKVKEAVGVKAKVAAIISNLKEGCQNANAKESARKTEHEQKMANVDPYVKAKLQVRKQK